MNELRNFIDGEWRAARASESVDVIDPATAEPLARVPLSGAAEVEDAVAAARRAFAAWRRVPPGDRIQCLFRLKQGLEDNLEDLARTITRECGKTLDEARGEMRRAIENVEVACGTPILMQGRNSEDIAPGIDEFAIRQPLGVVAIIAPFNFPGMIPFWFLPYAIACGNTCIVKPSEKVPLTMAKVCELLERAGLPKGVVNLVNGAAAAVDAILDHPDIRAVSFVGSTPVARHIYGRAAASGKRVQAQGGAKNAVVVLPDADMEMTTRIVADSAFGCAGQRCLAASVAVTVGEARGDFTEPHRRSRGIPRGGQRARSGRADGPGDYAAEQGAHREPDRAGYRRGRQGPGGRAQRRCPRRRARILRAPHRAGRRPGGGRTRAHGGLRPGAVARSRRDASTRPSPSSTAAATATWRACSLRAVPPPASSVMRPMPAMWGSTWASPRL